MHPSSQRMSSLRGSVFITSMIMVVVIAIAAASVLALVMSANRESMRTEMRMRARTVAESELEALFFKFKLSVLSGGTFVADVPAKLSGLADVASFPSTVRDCFLDTHRAEGWKVKRSLLYENDSYGQIPGTRKSGLVSYIVARVEVIPPPGATYGGAALRVGRHFSLSTSSVFQYGIFYESDLEFNPGKDVEVQGDVSSNKNIYMGSTASGNMIIGAMVRYPKGQVCNKVSETDPTVVYRKPGTLTSGLMDLPPIWAAGGQDKQTEEMDAPENLIGGVDANEVLKNNAKLFSSLNDVYRAVIVPPPGDTHEYPATEPDDPTISAVRIYNKAGLRINIEADGSINFYRGKVNVNSEFPGVVTPPVAMMDQREAKNVKVATVNIGALKAKIDAINATGDLSKQFNGILYINQKSGDSGAPTGVILTNAKETPETLNSSGKDLGFSLVTNGGIYIQGSFNTTHTAVTNIVNPSVIMGDAVTLLSDDWNVANSATAIDVGRSAGTTSQITPTNSTGYYYNGPTEKESIAVQVNAGILTGNTPARLNTDPLGATASGGAQNLIRYLERWSGSTHANMNTKIYGSLGCLFASKFFTAPFQQPGNVYYQPAYRYFNYNDAMRRQPPVGAPVIPNFVRGTFFYW